MPRAEKQRRRARRRERKAQRQHRLPRVVDAWMSQQPITVNASRAGVLHLTYDITTEPVAPDRPDPAMMQMTEEERAELFDLLHDDPEAALPRLIAWVERYPDSRILRNWLAMAYSSTGDNVSAERETTLLYEREPDYLFARVAMAQFCLHRGEIHRVAELFDHKLDLKLLYPQRNVFHLSEFLAFARVMVEYYLRKNEHCAAVRYHELMEEMDPEHPLTRQARGVMFGSTLLDLVKALSGRRLRRGKLP